MLLRDPVHGDISFSPRLTAVIDTKEVQRLRGIKQLGTAYLVYPGALHTRFDHSLGTCHLVGRILDHLALHGITATPEERELAQAAALVHDVSHIPFGHTFEDERRLFARHDEGGRLRSFLSEGELAETLERLGLRHGLLRLFGLAQPPVAPWLRQLVAGPIDADLLDYLKRDAYFTGLSHNYDERLYHTFTVADGQLAINLLKNNVERPDARSEIDHLLRIRYFLTERVYLHHAKVAAGAMISKAMELALEQGLTEQDLLWLTDSTFMERLRRLGDPHITRLVDAVEQRRLFKRAVVVSASSVTDEQRAELIELYGGQAPARSRLEAELAQATGLDPGQVIVYCPKASMFKEATMPVLGRAGLKPLRAHSGEAAELSRQYEQLWRFYIFCPAPAARRVAAEAQELLGLQSEYAPH